MVKQADAKHAMTWWENDAKYKARGRAMVIKYNDAWDDELEVMNKGKVGRPFSYSNANGFYCNTQGFVGEIVSCVCRGMDGSLDKFPTTITLWKRTAKTIPTFAVDPKFDPKLGITIRMAPDATDVLTT